MVVHGIITHHEGGIAVTSAPGHGTTVTVYLPRLAEAEAAPDRPPQAEELLPGGTERILFVDDEPAMATPGHEVLTRLGYQVRSVAAARRPWTRFVRPRRPLT